MRSLSLLFALLPLPALAGAADGTCDVALLLAVDVSNSVDEDEYAMQMDGLARALEDAEVAEALAEHRVALAVMQWSGTQDQILSIPWTIIESPADPPALGTAVRALPRAFVGHRTAPAEMLRAGLSVLAEAPPCERQVIDVSGDGARNVGGRVAAARDEAAAQGVTVNAIAIETTGRGVIRSFLADLVTPDGFVVAARGHRDYARAIRVKILRELSARIG